MCLLKISLTFLGASDIISQNAKSNYTYIQKIQATEFPQYSTYQNINKDFIILHDKMFDNLELTSKFHSFTLLTFQLFQI